MKKKIILVIILFIPIIVFAKELHMVEYDYTDEYRIWLSLSNEERKNRKKPQMYNYSNIKGFLIGDGENGDSNDDNDPDPNTDSEDPTDLDNDETSTVGNRIFLEEEATESSYSLKELNLVNGVRDQRDTNSCWAFATSDAVYSTFVKESEKKGITVPTDKFFSPGHIELIMNNDERMDDDLLKRIKFNRNINVGGNYQISSMYLLNLKGPIYEEDPDSTHTLKEELKFIDYIGYIRELGSSVAEVAGAEDINFTDVDSFKPVVEVNNIGEYIDGFNSGCTSEAIATIKKLIKNIGPVAANMYIPEGANQAAEEDLYFSSDYRYYNFNKTGFGIPEVNHGIQIVGWDDEVSPDSFNTNSKPTAPGAWLIKNSHGSASGDNGYFYISYEDIKICNGFNVFYDIDTEISDNYYGYDELGYNSTLRNNVNKDDKLYLANKFTRNTQNSENEKIDRVSMYFAEAGMNYNIYYSSTGALNKYRLIASGKVEIPGYVSTKIPEDNKVVINDEFAIIYEIIFPKDGLFSLYTIGSGEDINNAYNGSKVGGDPIDRGADIYATIKVTTNVSYMAYNSSGESAWSLLQAPRTTIPLNNTIRLYTTFVGNESQSTTEGEVTAIDIDDTDIIIDKNINNLPISDEVMDVVKELNASSLEEEKDYDTTENPKTGAILSIVMILTAAILLVVILTYYKKNRITYKI